MKSVIKSLRLVLIICMITVPAFLFAQADPDPTTPPPPGDGGNDTQDVPFDGGVSLLVAAGLVYGLKKANDKKKMEKV